MGTGTTKRDRLGRALRAALTELFGEPGSPAGPREEHAELRALLDEQRRIKRELDESRAGFMDVFRRAPNEMLLTRVSDLCILDVNDAWVRVSGYSRDRVVGKSSLEFDWWPDPRVRDLLVDGIRTRGYVEAVEASFVTASGEHAYCLMSGQTIVLNGEPCVVWQSQDITALRRAEKERSALAARTKEHEKLESLGMLAGGIAHDFNNLLVGILGNAELLRTVLPGDAPASSYARAITAGAERASALTRELLDYAGRGSTTFEPVELRALLEELAVLCVPHVPPHAEFRRVVPARELWVDGDASQLTRMLLNMVKNGCDALDGRPGVVSLSLSLENTPEGERAIMRVSDTGHGLDEATQKRVFDPFFTTKSRGAGLGLAAAQGIVHRHHGSLSLTSQKGAGTTFTIALPTRVAPLVSAPLHEPEGVDGHGRLLLVDDEASVRQTAGLLLGHLGFEVVEAASGERALELVTADPTGFRLAMLDVTMPGLDGWKTLAGLRRIAPNLPVLMCSGYSRKDSASELADVPLTSFLGKPFRMQELARELRALLDEAESARPSGTRLGRPSVAPVAPFGERGLGPVLSSRDES